MCVIKIKRMRQCAVNKSRCRRGIILGVPKDAAIAVIHTKLVDTCEQAICRLAVMPGADDNTNGIQQKQFSAVNNVLRNILIGNVFTEF